MCHLCAIDQGRRFGANIARAARQWNARVPSRSLRDSDLSESAATDSESVIIGSGQYRYRVIHDWGKLPAGISLAEGTAVCVDSNDNVYVFNRGKHPVIVFDRAGNFLRSWGEDIGFTRAHGAAIGPDDLLYLTDDHGHAVRKCSPDGNVLMTIGVPNHPAPRFGGEPFNLCTHTALSPRG
ncbi:MAG: hypothetical protein GTO41_02005, partial [Burkholderiales bacterium]|nr:hypothetical protein [Burkholderiales bacterium]